MSKTECACGKPTSGAWLCDKCEKTFAYAQVNIGVYYVDMRTVAAKATRYGSVGATKGSIGKAQPLVVDLRFVSGPPDATPAHPGASIASGSQLQWDAWNTIHSWCRTVMEENPEVRMLGPICDACWHKSCTNVRRNRWPRNTVTSMINYLARQQAWILKQQWVTQMMDELTDLERRLSRFVDRPADRWYAGKCSVPDGEGADCPTELYATADRGWIDCPTCGIRHDVAERRDVLLEEAKDYHVTATEAAGALLAWTDYDGTENNLIKRISEWRDRDRLEVKDVTSLLGKDRHLYRLGDIQDLLIEHAQRKQRRTLGVVH